MLDFLWRCFPLKFYSQILKEKQSFLDYDVHETSTFIRLLAQLNVSRSFGDKNTNEVIALKPRVNFEAHSPN